MLQLINGTPYFKITHLNCNFGIQTSLHYITCIARLAIASFFQFSAQVLESMLVMNDIEADLKLSFLPVYCPMVVFF